MITAITYYSQHFVLKKTEKEWFNTSNDKCYIVPCDLLFVSTYYIALYS